MVSHGEGIEVRHGHGQARLEAAQSREPVVLVAARRFNPSQEVSLGASLTEAMEQPIEPVVALEGVIELKDMLDELFVLIYQDKVSVAFAGVDAEIIGRHGTMRVG